MLTAASTAHIVSPDYSQDPLRVSTPLPFHDILYPFGFPVSIKSNEQAVIRAAAESWGAFQQTYRTHPIEVRFVVSEATSRRRPPVPSFRAQANLLMIVADRNNFAACDLAAGFGFASISKAATTHRDYIRQHFVESMVYTLLDTSHTIAIHAACVEYQGHGVLLLGDSGAGKSSLAYAAARRGWSYLCDDASSLVLHKTGRTVVGNPRTIRFRPSALPLFPEITGRAKVRNGKPKIEIQTERLPHIRTVVESRADYIVFLKRSSEPVAAKMTPLVQQDVLRRFAQSPWPPELLVHEQRGLAIERLLAAQAFDLEYRELDLALNLIESVIRGEKS